MSEEYTLVSIKKRTLSMLEELCGKPVSDCIEEIVDALKIPDTVLENFMRSREEAKLLGYAGGDWYIKDELISMALRVPLKKATFVEVFGGSGVLSQYVPRSKFPNIIYNDIDKDLVALHEYVKNNPRVLASVLFILPFSRYVREHLYKHYAWKEFGSLIGAVVLFYILRTGYFGTFRAELGTVIKPHGSGATRYASALSAIYSTAERFRDVVIECASFEYIIKKYDTETTLFYLDPPFVSSESTDRSDFYRHVFSESDAVRLAKMLRNIKGYYMLKISEDNEKYYKSLNAVDRAEIIKKKSMELVRDNNRRDVKIVVLANYKLTNPNALTNLHFFTANSP